MNKSSFQNQPDLAREAVSWNAGLDGNFGKSVRTVLLGVFRCIITYSDMLCQFECSRYNTPFALYG
jgi:hypothetical protein